MRNHSFIILILLACIVIYFVCEVLAYFIEEKAKKNQVNTSNPEPQPAKPKAKENKFTLAPIMDEGVFVLVGHRSFFLAEGDDTIESAEDGEFEIRYDADKPYLEVLIDKNLELKMVFHLNNLSQAKNLNV